MTKIIRGLYNIDLPFRGAVVTIGNFDGVHKGHQALIAKVKERALSLHAPSIVMTFEPQPLEFFAADQPIGRLTRWREKYFALVETHIDAVFVLRFNQAVAHWSPEEFIKRILVDGLAIKHMIIGDDFRFGRNREGDIASLEQAGIQHGFSVEKMETVLIDGERVSSTRIRQLLEKDNQQAAEHLLGHPYAMMGRVVHGNKLGRELGFPTANIYLHRQATAVHGIYAVKMHGIEKQALLGVANVGTRPAVGGTRSLLEVYLFNFDRDIYGKQVKVEFCKKIRDEKYFANLDLLKEAIAQDVAQAHHYFRERGEL